VTTFFRGLGRPQGLAFDCEGNLFVAASLGGRRGIVRITPQGRADLALSGSGIVGMALLRMAVPSSPPPRHYLLWTGTFAASLSSVNLLLCVTTLFLLRSSAPLWLRAVLR